MDNNRFLYEIMEVLEEASVLDPIPHIIESGLSDNIKLRDYQIRAFRYFVSYFENPNLRKNKKVHTLFHMATGSGKTVIMAGLILYLYTRGYRKFLFFVNQTNVVEKTKDNFLNDLSNKYLFNKSITYLGDKINIRQVNSFYDTPGDDDIQICFTTTQKLHLDLLQSKENTLSYNDFENNKIVFISDESHHINSLTKKASQSEILDINSWEYSVMNAFNQNNDNIMLEFTATADIKDTNVKNKYMDKMIFNYALPEYRESGYTKDFQNFATESELWDRALMAMIISEYRKYLFADIKQDIKPVILFKSQKICDSKNFYDSFFEKLEGISTEEIKELYRAEMEYITTALDYFKEKDETFNFLIQSLKNSFTLETSIEMNESTDNNREKQLKVNSLEDKNNQIRAIFTVDMLNEGWDVLNLFDIVRLYDTRQGSGTPGKIGNYTIKEAQLIGRGARYCPFIENELQEKYKRKYDYDVSNKYRILETMLFHSRNDSRYIAELKQALIATGLQAPTSVKLDYKIKKEFKSSEFYNKAIVFSNTRIVKNRNEVNEIDNYMKNKIYHYTAKNNRGQLINLFGSNDTINSSDEKTQSIKFKDVDYNILSGAFTFFNELRFDVIKNRFPNVKSTKEFLQGDNYLGNSTIEIKYDENYTSFDLFNACKKAMVEISNYILQIKSDYKGTEQFEPIRLKDILTDKSIYLSQVESNGGKGTSQNNCINEEYRLNLEDESWYVFNDNYGTSEEKLFIKYFKTNIVPKLENKKLEYYVIRNERNPAFAIYDFENGNKFEPDFVVIITKKTTAGLKIKQVYAEPKGSHLLETDRWKEQFLLQIGEKSYISPLYSDGNNYHIYGLPFFNKEERIREFENAVDELISKL